MSRKLQRPIFLTLFFSTLILIPSSAHAAKSFESLDTNQDGIVSQEEWMAGARGEYESLDRNGNGNISYNEFHGIASSNPGNRYGANKGYKNGKRRQPRFEDMDANHDGVLSKDEWPADAVEYYTALDANADGNVSYNEFFNRKQISASVLKGLDTNNDNRISRGEWTGEAAEFNRIDKNADNFLTVAELSADSSAQAASTSTTTDSSSLEDIFLKLLQR